MFMFIFMLVVVIALSRDPRVCTGDTARCSTAVIMALVTVHRSPTPSNSTDTFSVRTLFTILFTFCSHSGWL